MAFVRRLHRITVDSETLTFLRLLSLEFNRGSVDDAIMVYHENSVPVNLYGTLAYRITDSGTPNPRAHVSTLVYDSITSDPAPQVINHTVIITHRKEIKIVTPSLPERIQEVSLEYNIRSTLKDQS
ncbi:hypothetical protein DFH28DRAFT_929399 [Melampsora americana]|nr:hypothetical protein DFH28DRAFT_929399 [Melampsora americana]